MNTHMAELAERTEQASAFLARYGVKHWADWLAADAARIRQADLTGVDHLLQAFGGTGSLNDVWISPEHGNPIGSDDVEEVNEELSMLLNNLYALADRLRKSHR